MERYQVIFEGLPIPMIMLGPDHRVDNINLAAVNLLDEISPGVEQPAGFSGKTPAEIMPWLNADFQVFMGQAVSERRVEKEIAAGHRPARSLFITFKQIFDTQGDFVGTSIVINDLTRIKTMEDKLQYSRIYDELTGAHNRQFFDQELNHFERTDCFPCGIIVCDIDGLKQVNDSLGHQAGDRLLATTASLLKETTRGKDLVARLGSDEFAVFLPYTETNLVEETFKNIRSAVDEYNKLHGDFPLKISMGYSMRSPAREALRSLLTEAANHMQREKLYSEDSSRSGIVHTLIKVLKERQLIEEADLAQIEDLTIQMARSIGYLEHSLPLLRLFVRFHDIGKVGVADKILFKVEGLTPEEYAEIKNHADIGRRIALSSVELAPIADLIFKHHEWWNGDGYPTGIEGSAIPIECRILSIVTAYHAMVSSRPYRPAMSHDEAVNELKRFSGTQFDPALLNKFLDLIEKKKNP